MLKLNQDKVTTHSASDFLISFKLSNVSDFLVKRKLKTKLSKEAPTKGIIECQSL
ncbi:MAG: hypothetical protein V8R83_04595 [Candidatus Gastranaerophilaceae bacterium]